MTMSSQADFQKTIEDWASMYLFRSLTEFFKYLKISDLSMLQAYALTYVYYNGPSKISDLCDHMMVSAAAASQMVDRLEKQKLVKRIASAEDRRVRNVVLSGKGEKFVRQSIVARQSWLQELPPQLTVEQQEQIIESIKILISLSMDESEGAAQS
jgi:DNA-binding MarR family transcriptional regulator